MAFSQPKNIVIVGGSLGGLFAGITLKHLDKNLNIRIFERNPTALLHDQGAGVVAGSDVQQFFLKHDRTQTPLAVTSHQRVYLDRYGRVMSKEEKEQKMTSWNLLYNLLRANFDGVESAYAKPSSGEHYIGTTTSYEYGCTVEKVRVPASSASPEDFSSPIEIQVKRHSGAVFSANADMVIAADGSSSAIRSQFFPNVKPEYAGYVAWRGAVLELDMSPSATEAFSEKFAFFHGPGIQILAYLIPGKDGTIEPGQRLMNWVWYCNYEPGSDELTSLMTDKSGRRHHVTLPPGEMQEHIWTQQKSYATKVLPPRFAELVNKTEVPFIQTINDVIVPKAMMEGGRILLLGDALAGFRPHTAASTSQAAMNALTLAEAFEKMMGGEGLQAFKQWDMRVVQFAKEMQRHGVELGERSQFGEHPLRG